MKIQPISPVSPSAPSGGQSGQHSALERQILELQKQIANVKESKMETKAKAEKIKELEAQISELQTQLSQQAMKERQKELEEAQRKMAEKLEREAREHAEPEQVQFSMQAKNLMKATQSLSEAETLRGVQSRLPTQEERDAFAPKVAAKAYEAQKELAKATEEQNRHAAEGHKRAAAAAESEDDAANTGASRGGSLVSLSHGDASAPVNAVESEMTTTPEGSMLTHGVPVPGEGSELTPASHQQQEADGQTKPPLPNSSPSIDIKA